MIFRFIHCVIRIVHFFLILDFLQVSACQFFSLVSFFRASEYDSTMCSSGIEGLPYEMLAKILSYVPHDDFGNVRLVCRRFNAVSYDASLWGEVSLPTLASSLDQSRN
jgi:F-box-like